MSATESPRSTKKVKKVASFSTNRKLPNILVSGTPGVGKSTLCEVLAEKVSIVSLSHLTFLSASI